MKNEFNLDKIIQKLLAVKGKKPGKKVNLPEEDIMQLCLRS